jgi:hypothetical protein
MTRLILDSLAFAIESVVVLQKLLAKDDIPGGVAIRDGQFLETGNFLQRAHSDASLFKESLRVGITGMIDESSQQVEPETETKGALARFHPDGAPLDL